jgi:hypothetical protein
VRKRQAFRLLLQFIEPLGQVSMYGGQLAHANEGAHDKDAHLHSLR